MLENRIDRVTIRNYRSLGDVTIELEDLTVFIGENGSGKSNFLDVLRFVKDALQQGLDAALISNDRGELAQFDVILQKVNHMMSLYLLILL